MPGRSDPLSGETVRREFTGPVVEDGRSPSHIRIINPDKRARSPLLRREDGRPQRAEMRGRKGRERGRRRGRHHQLLHLVRTVEDGPRRHAAADVWIEVGHEIPHIALDGLGQGQFVGAERGGLEDRE